jgi:hypothetical protein
MPPQPEPSKAAPSKPLDAAESARVLATERLRLQAETAQNRNIVMELSLDRDHIIWLNYAWVVVVGYVHRLPHSVSELTNGTGRAVRHAYI